MFKNIFSRSYIFGIITSLFFIFGLAYASSWSIGDLYEKLIAVENDSPVSWVYRLVWQNIEDGTVTNYELATGAVTAPKIANSTVTTADLAPNSVTSAKILSSTIVTADVSSSFKAPFADKASESGTASTIAWIDLALEKEVVDELNAGYIEKPSTDCDDIWEIIQLTPSWKLICTDTSSWSS